MTAFGWSIVAVNVGAAAAMIVAGLAAHAFFFIALRRFAARGHIPLDKSISLHCAAPLRLIFPLLALDIALPSLDIHSSVDALVQRVRLSGMPSPGWTLSDLCLPATSVVNRVIIATSGHAIISALSLCSRVI